MSLSREQCLAYLRRIGIDEEPTHHRDGLARIHQAHLLTVPFENLDIHLGRPLSLDVDDLFEKIVVRGHGGFCYELNGLFAELLEALGFVVTRMAARVEARDSGELGPPRDHLCLHVMLREPFLCDVGFGRGFRKPLLLTNMDWQSDGRNEYRVQPGNPEWTVYSRERRLYCFDSRALALKDFEEMCRYHQTSPDSPFPKNRVWTKATPEGRITLRGDVYVEEHGEKREERSARDEDWARCRPS